MTVQSTTTVELATSPRPVLSEKPEFCDPENCCCPKHVVVTDVTAESAGERRLRFTSTLETTSRVMQCPPSFSFECDTLGSSDECVGQVGLSTTEYMRSDYGVIISTPCLQVDPVDGQVEVVDVVTFIARLQTDPSCALNGVACPSRINWTGLYTSSELLSLPARVYLLTPFTLHVACRYRTAAWHKCWAIANSIFCLCD